MKNLRTSEVLDLAADAIQMAGWARGQRGWPGYPGSDGSLCLEGGIMVALGLEERDRGRIYTCPIYRAVQDYLDTHEFLFLFNDAQGRTQQEVIEVLRAAAAVERTKEAVYSDEDQPLPLEQEQVA